MLLIFIYIETIVVRPSTNKSIMYKIPDNDKQIFNSKHGYFVAIINDTAINDVSSPFIW